MAWTPSSSATACKGLPLSVQPLHRLGLELAREPASRPRHGSPVLGQANLTDPSSPSGEAHLRQNKLGLRVWPDHEAIVATCREAWNWLTAARDRLASITRREWAEAVNN